MQIGAKWISLTIIIAAAGGLSAVQVGGIARGDSGAAVQEATPEVTTERNPRQSSPQVTVEIIEGIPAKRPWDYDASVSADSSYALPAFALIGLPKKYSDGLIVDREGAFVVRASASISLPAGVYRFVLRSQGASRLSIDDRVVAQTDFRSPKGNGHESMSERPSNAVAEIRALAPGHQETLVEVELDGELHEFCLEGIVGAHDMRVELKELSVGFAAEGQPFRLLAPRARIPYSSEAWDAYSASAAAQLAQIDAQSRAAMAPEQREYWERRHHRAAKEWRGRSIEVPKLQDRWPAHNEIDRFVFAELERQGIGPPARLDDEKFLRRVTLDTVGLIPSSAEIAEYQSDPSEVRRSQAVERLLSDPRWADHWVAYWQDVLAENPGLIRPELNNTGPFRWWIYESFLDNKPFDRFVTELIEMKGSTYYGGPAGFALATNNDAPMAEKAHVISRAFLGVELKCARCHDAVSHPYTQRDMFSLAAMLDRKTLRLPETSTVPPSRSGRVPAVEISLKPGDKIEPNWPFEQFIDVEDVEDLVRDPDDPRERLAALVTSPANERFAQVTVNHLWLRYFGWGLVDNLDDWDGAPVRYPQLLDWLSRELITHNYDLKHVARLILSSRVYQSAVPAHGGFEGKNGNLVLAVPASRRMSAEQLVDSLFVAVGKPIGSEELTFDPEGRQPVTQTMNLGTPTRAWQFASMSNERDRPALSLPVAQSVVDLLSVYGWRESRQHPISVRDDSPNALQPLLLANGIIGARATTLSDDSDLTQICLQAESVEALIEVLFERVLSRKPLPQELDQFSAILSDGFERRRTGVAPNKRQQGSNRSNVSWSNHLSAEATNVKLESERAAREGDPPTRQLETEWRERMEDCLWVLINSPEFIIVP